MFRLSPAVLLVALLFSSVAMAQEEDAPVLRASEVQLSVLALDKERPGKILVRYDDRNSGLSLQIVEVPTGKQKKGWFMESRADERRKLRGLRRRQFKIEAVVDQVEPRGRYTIMGAPGPHRKRYQVLAMRDGRVGVLANLPLKKVPGTDTFAAGMLKEVVWAPNGKMIICVLNQKMKLEDGKYDVDELHFVRFRAWKVKWMKAEGGDGGSKSK